jgi:hypothetical protein
VDKEGQGVSFCPSLSAYFCKNSVGMLSALMKKKLSANQMSNVFINGLVEVIKSSYPVFSEIVNDDTAFVTSPNLGKDHQTTFAFIVFAANLNRLESSFDPEHAAEVETEILFKLSKYFGQNLPEFKAEMKEYQKFINKINHPSKNLVYGMSKALFAKYELHNFQDEYFKRLAAPNPLFLKRMDELMQLFIWDWDAFFKKYKL